MASDLYKQDFGYFRYSLELTDHLRPYFTTAYSPHKHYGAGQLANILALGRQDNAEELSFKIRLVLRDEVCGGISRHRGHLNSPNELKLDDIQSNLRKIGLSDCIDSSDLSNRQLQSVETLLLATLCQSYRTAFEEARQEAVYIAQTVEKLSGKNSDFRNQTGVKRSTLSTWLDRAEYKTLNALSKTTLFGAGFQKRVTRSASNRYRKEYDQ